MSDEAQGEGWWLAANGKWYPPGAPRPDEGADPSDAEAARDRRTARQGFGCLAAICAPIVLFIGLAAGFAAETSAEANVAYVIVGGGLVLAVVAFALWAIDD